MFDTLIASALLNSLTMTLFHFMWQGALIGLLLKSALLVVSVQKSQLRYGLSCLAMFASLVVPMITFVLIYQNGAHNPIGDSSLLLANSANAELASGMQASWIENLNHYSAYISLFWLAIVCGLSMRLIVQLWSVNQLPTRRTQKPNDELQQRFEQLVARLTLFRKPELLVSLKVNVPMAIGWLKPVVLLPASMISGLTPAQLDMLLMHELAHIRRHDYLVNFLQTLVEILLFFHPSVHWIGKQMRNEREYCSDDIAVHHCGDPIAYAHTLADTATICKKHRHMPIPSIAMAASGGDLKQRVVRLVDHHCTSSNHSGKWLASVAILIAIMLGSINQLLLVSAIDFNTGKLNLGAEQGIAAPANSASSNLVANLTEGSIAKQLLNQGIENILPASESWLENESIVAPPANNSAQYNQAALNSENLAAKQLTQQELAQASSNLGSSNSALKQNNKISPTDLSVSISSQEQSSSTQTTPSTNASSLDNPLQKTSSKELTNVAQSPALNRNERTAMNVEQQLTIAANAPLTSTSDKLALSNRAQVNPYAQELAALRSEELNYSKKRSTFQNATLSELGKNDGNSNTVAQTVFDKYPSSASGNLTTLTSELNSSLAQGFTNSKPTVPEDLPALLVSSSEPKYPAAAKRRGIELDVMVHFTVDRNGNVTDIMFERKNKVNYFRSSIRNAISKWRFQPAQQNGEAVESRVSKIFSFNLLQ